MQIASITKNGEYDGSHIIVASKDEMQTVANILTIYCDEHKKMRKAKTIRNLFDDLEIW